jgi:hypothetical protein
MEDTSDKPQEPQAAPLINPDPPASTTTATPTDTTPPVQPTPIVSASQMGWNQNDKPRSKKPLVIIAICLVLLVGTLVALYFTNIIAFSRFKTITYDNGKGSSFRLKFYSKYSVQNVAQSTADTPKAEDNPINPNLKHLVSKVSVSDKLPLTLFITGGSDVSEKANKGQLAMANNDCTQNGMDKAFDAHIDFINADVVVCKITQNLSLGNIERSVVIANIATFHNGDKGYIAYFSQDIDFAKNMSSPENARTGLAKVGLEDYQDDITTILASVKPQAK